MVPPSTRDNPDPMQPKEMEVVTSFIKAINAHDLTALEGLMTDDHTFVDGVGRRSSGREAMIVGWGQYYDMFPDYVIRVDDILHDGPLVAVFGTTYGTYTGPDGVQPENEVGGPAAWRAVVASGKVQFWQVYTDYTDTWKVIKANQEL